jgi:hypothetical protein
MAVKYKDRFAPPHEGDYFLELGVWSTDHFVPPTESMNTFNWDFFYKIKQPKEKVGLVKVHKRDLNLRYPHVKTGMQDFLQSGRNLTYEQVMELYSTNFRFFTDIIEVPTRLSFLTKEFIENGKFRNPIGGIWNTKLNLFSVHPGTGRVVVLDIFHKGEIEMLAFNSKGAETNFSKIFSSKEEIFSHFNHIPEDDIKMVLTTDFGTVVPHIHLGTSKNVEVVTDHFKVLREFFQQYRLVANFNLLDWKYYEVDDTKVPVYLNIFNPNDLLQQLGSILLAPIFQEYNSGEIKISLTGNTVL